MRFENLYTPRIDQMEELEMAAFIRGYRDRRAKEITPVAVDIPAAKVMKAKLTPEELVLLKSVGITARMLKTLRTETEEEDEDGLFDD
jgi:adenosyl cobinamide kinase/adenosyl cobinamide phosphate guanylyltransferase